MEKILSDFGVQPILLAAQIVNFLVLLFILQKLLYKPVLKILEERKRKIEESLSNSEKTQKELEETEARREKVINEAIDEGKKIIAEATAQSNILREQSIENTKKEMENMMEEGRQMISGEKEKMKTEIKSEVATMIAMTMEKVLGKGLDSNSQKKLVDDAMRSMKQ